MFDRGKAAQAAIPVERAALDVLVIDDFQNMRATLKQLLLRAGFVSIDFAVNARSAFEAIEKKSYDIILCDYNLGSGADGEQILESGRSQGWIGPGAVVVMVTAEATGEMVLSALEVEPDGYLTKPFSPQQLDLRINRGLRRRHALRRLDPAWRHDEPAAVIAELTGVPATWRPDERRLAAHLAWRLGDLKALERLLDAQESLGETTWVRFFRASLDEVRGDLTAAEKRLQQLLVDVPQFLPAADRLASIERRTGRLMEAHARISASRAGSEKSFARQVERARIAKAFLDTTRRPDSSQQSSTAHEDPARGTPVSFESGGSAGRVTSRGERPSSAVASYETPAAALVAAGEIAERLVPFDPLMAVRWLSLVTEIESDAEVVNRLRGRIVAMQPALSPWWRLALEWAAVPQSACPDGGAAAGVRESWPSTRPPTRALPWWRERLSDHVDVTAAPWTQSLGIAGDDHDGDGHD